MNNTFNFSRFTAVLKCDLVEHRWRYISVFFIMFVALIYQQIDIIGNICEARQLLPDWEFEATYTTASDALCFNTYQFFFSMLALALICAASDMSAVPFKTKGRSMNYLMMPASNLEKFLSRVFVNLVMVVIMAYLALFLADLVRMLYVTLNDIEGFGGFNVFTALKAWLWPLKMMYKDGGPILGVMTVIAIVLTVCYVYSIILIGGCIWRKRALLKILFIGLIVFLLYACAHVRFIEPWIVDVFDPWTKNVLGPWLGCNFESANEFTRFFLLVTIPLELAYVVLVAFNWRFAYRFFSRKQMIPRTLFGGKHPHHLLKKAHS